MFLKGGFLYVADYFGWKFRSDDKSYLFASDHFGLMAKFSLKNMDQNQIKSLIV
jgi:hypothetical protein